MRIIAGAASGRRLAVPRSGTRPTSDRVREALFSSLSSSFGGWEGVRVLDLYAGSGALGLEALSRGAAHVTFVERSPRAVSILRANIATVGIPGTDVVVREALATVSGAAPTEPFDLVLADPPYDIAVEDVRDVLSALARPGWTADNALAIVERSARARDEPWPAHEECSTYWELLRRKDYGDTSLWYGQRRSREAT